MLTSAGASLGRPNRGVPPSEACWELETTLDRDKMAARDAGLYMASGRGLVAGLSIFWDVRRRHWEDNGGGTVELEFDAANLDEVSDSFAHGPTPGMGFEIEVTTPASVKRGNCFLWKEQQDGRVEDVFGEPWAEVVREGSPFFPGGQMLVKVKFKLLAK